MSIAPAQSSIIIGGSMPRSLELDHLICYAVKANSNRAILHLLAREGAGFDIVSGGELFRVLAAGGDPRQVHLCRSRQIARGNRIRARAGVS